MWQKERLLNLAVESLPPHCDRVAWIDADIVFQDEDWPAAANAALDCHPIIQPFETSHELSRDAGPGEIDTAHAYITCRSLARGLAIGEVNPEIMLLPNKRGLGIAIGLAWAAHRDVLQKHGLYDAHILDGGVNALVAGIRGRFQDSTEYMLLNPRRRQHYLDWARPFHDTIRDDLGWCSGMIFHLWHGDLADRAYDGRRGNFAEFDFDPYTDIAIEKGGAWRWNSDKPKMHRFVRDYFASRFEDGRPDEVGAGPIGIVR